MFASSHKCSLPVLDRCREVGRPRLHETSIQSRPIFYLYDGSSMHSASLVPPTAAAVLTKNTTWPSSESSRLASIKYMGPSKRPCMECPNCKSKFHPQMTNRFMGEDKDKQAVYVFYQLCPSCKEPIIGMKRGKPLMLASDTEGLTLLIPIQNQDKPN